MTKFIGGNEKTVDVGDPVFFENKTDSNYEVSAGIIFKKSGVYEVSIAGNRTCVTKVTERKSGKWINHRNVNGLNIVDCDQCGHSIQWFDGDETPKYCCMCGSYNGGEWK